MEDFFGEPLFQPTGTDWIDHAFTAAVLDDMEREERARHSWDFAISTTDREKDSDAGIGPTTSRPMTYQEAVDFFVDMAVKRIKQEYEELGDWWTVYPALVIYYQNTHVWFMQRKMKDIFAFPSEMPLEGLCKIRKIVEPWLKTKCDKHTFMFTDPILMNHLASTTFIHYTPGASNADTLMEFKAMLGTGQISKREYQKYIDIVQGTGK